MDAQTLVSEPPVRVRTRRPGRRAADRAGRSARSRGHRSGAGRAADVQRRSRADAGRRHRRRARPDGRLGDGRPGRPGRRRRPSPTSARRRRSTPSGRPRATASAVTMQQHRHHPARRVERGDRRLRPPRQRAARRRRGQQRARHRRRRRAGGGLRRPAQRPHAGARVRRRRRRRRRRRPAPGGAPATRAEPGRCDRGAGHRAARCRSRSPTAATARPGARPGSPRASTDVLAAAGGGTIVRPRFLHELADLVAPAACARRPGAVHRSRHPGDHDRRGSPRARATRRPTPTASRARRRPSTTSCSRSTPAPHRADRAAATCAPARRVLSGWVIALLAVALLVPPGAGRGRPDRAGDARAAAAARRAVARRPARAAAGRCGARRAGGGPHRRRPVEPGRVPVPRRGQRRRRRRLPARDRRRRHRRRARAASCRAAPACPPAIPPCARSWRVTAALVCGCAGAALAIAALPAAGLLLVPALHVWVLLERVTRGGAVVRALVILAAARDPGDPDRARRGPRRGRGDAADQRRPDADRRRRSGPPLTLAAGIGSCCKVHRSATARRVR